LLQGILNLSTGNAPMKIFIFFIFFVFLFSVSSNSIAANISVKEIHRSNVILVEGEIVNGDFEKFVEAVLQGGTRANNVFIASVGGDALESMRIGRLIRDLKFSTIAPLKDEKGHPYCDWAAPIANSKNCTCLSSCVLIYLSGINRKGTYLGVHRTFIKHETLKKLPINKASDYSKKVSQLVREYLSYMSAPSSLSEKIESVSSDNIEFLSEDYIRRYLDGFSKDIEEWLIAQCGGGEDKLFFSNFGRKASSDAKDEWIKDFVNITGCKNRIMWRQIGRSFYPVINQVLLTLNTSNIPRRSILSSILKLDRSNEFELTDLIGKNVFDALDLLTLLGFGQDFSTKEINLAFGHGLRIDETLFVGISREGNVKSFELWFLEREGDDSFFYKNHFLNRINSDSSLEDFEKVYGAYKFKEEDSGYFLLGGKEASEIFYIFNYRDFDIKAKIHNKDNRLTGLYIDTKGTYADNKRKADELFRLIENKKIIKHQ
jgi:hypothetical protein